MHAHTVVLTWRMSNMGSEDKEKVVDASADTDANHASALQQRPCKSLTTIY